MSTTSRRIVPVTTLIGVAILASLAAYMISPFDTPPLAAAIFVALLPVWFIFFGGGMIPVGRDSVVIRKDVLGVVDVIKEGRFLYIPIIHTIEARLPNYPLKHEFTIEAIDTRTKFLNRIKQIKARSHYHIEDYRAFFEASANVIGLIKDLEQHSKLIREEPALWKRVISEVIHTNIDDVTRDTIWSWDAHVKRNAGLMASIPFGKNIASEDDPYTLSLNRLKLARQIQTALDKLFESWGLKVDKLVFETIEVDESVLKAQTRNKQGEVDEARHQAQIAAVGITLKGQAEVDVRAATVAKVLEVLIDKKHEINLTNEVLYNIVRAAMYSDGEMVWQGVVEAKGNGAGTVKTA